MSDPNRNDEGHPKAGDPSPVQLANMVFGSVPPMTVFAGPLSGSAAPPVFRPISTLVAAGGMAVAGPAGIPGATWRDGQGAPPATLGADGDYYLNAASGAVYRRAGGAYSIVASIRGPAGPASTVPGPPGPQGIPGPPGPAGAGTGGGSLTGPRRADLRDTLPAPATVDDLSTYLDSAQRTLINTARTDLGRPNDTRGIILIPPGDWPIRSPFALEDGIELRGSGPGISVIKVSDYINPILMGVRRRAAWDRNKQDSSGLKFLANAPAIFAADHRVDAFGIMDAGFASQAGKRWGISTKSASSGSPYADHFVSFWSTPPATGCGERWESIQTLVIDMAFIDLGGDGLIGMGGTDGPMPFILYRYFEPAWNRRVFRLNFRTAEGVCNPDDAPRAFWFGDATRLPGLRRLSVLLDMSHADSSGVCVCAAWVDRKAVQVGRWQGTRLVAAVAGQEPSFTPADGLHLRANTHLPFHIGNTDPNDTTWGAYTAPADRAAIQVFGLYLGSGADYGTDAAGNQVRADGGPMADLYQFDGAGRTGLIARLKTDDPPAADWPGRRVRMVTGPRTLGCTVSGLFLPEGGDLEGTTVYARDNAASDLEIDLQNNLGCGITLGASLDPQFRNVAVGGGWGGIGCLLSGATYTVKGRDLWVSGRGFGYHGHEQIARLENLYGGMVSYHQVLISGGADLALRGCQVGGFSSAGAAVVTILDGAYGWSYTISGITTDQEGPPAAPLLVCLTPPDQINVYLSVTDCIQGYAGPDDPAIVLSAAYPNKPGGTGYYDVARVSSNAGAGVIAAGATWRRGQPPPRVIGP